MNFWIAKLGSEGLTDDNIQKISDDLADHPVLARNSTFHYRAKAVHYFSVHTQPRQGSRSYHYSDQNGSLTAYSGLPVGHGAGDSDYKNAKSIHQKATDPVDFTHHVTGQYAAIRAFDNHFECVVDCLGFHRVFYYKAAQETVYVSNYPRLVKLFKPEDKNLEFYTTWLSVGEIYGNSSDENDLIPLPFYGHLDWSSVGGLKIKQYKTIDSLVNPDQSADELIEATGNEFRGTAEYLTTYHQSVIPLSGGFDSRLILDSFTGQEKSGVESFTYPDHPNDLSLAIKVANNRGYKHRVLAPDELPDFETLHEYAVKSEPFATYGTIFDYLFESDLKQIFNDAGKVKISGNGGGGGSGFGLKRLASLKGYTGNELISLLVNRSINEEILSPEAHQSLQSTLETYFQQNYSPFIEEADAYRKIGSILFLLERFGRYQSYKMLYSNKHLGDSYLPYGSENFIKTVFQIPVKNLSAAKNGSLHHQLSLKLTNGSVTPLPFATSRHWDADIWRRWKYRLRQAYTNSTTGDEIKYSSIVRTNFFINYRKEYEEVLNSTGSSDLWQYINRDLMLKWVSKNEETSDKQIKMLSRIVPLLKSGL